MKVSFVNEKKFHGVATVAQWVENLSVAAPVAEEARV